MIKKKVSGDDKRKRVEKVMGGFKMERAANRGLRLLFRELLIRSDIGELHSVHDRISKPVQP